ncbi:hypothetical protein EMCG_00917 [[Emmonsia] crescens]|uniref:Uncharacterized protein n=1 Tax=[Emmonsia] crescens TaxID=73230 RepID=A0A0G2HNT0_9EURO|nr:hypothetical protein EMCG_00917 [Emmonsia crescens UAMH 3008]
MMSTTCFRAQSADVIDGFSVESIDNQTMPSSTAVQMQAASSVNNNDEFSTLMQDSAVTEIAAEEVEFFNQNTIIFNTLNELQLKLQIFCIECEKAKIECDNLCLCLKLMKHQSNHLNQFNQSNSNLSNSLNSSIFHLHDQASEDFIKRLQNLCIKLLKIDYAMSDWQILNILYKELSECLHEFIQIKIEIKCMFKAVAVILNIDILLDEISTCLPAEINQSKSIDFFKLKSKDDIKPNKSPTCQQSCGRHCCQSRSCSHCCRRSQFNTTHSNINTTPANTTTPINITISTSECCSYCRRHGHEDSSCHYKNPHMCNEAWCHDNRHLIDHFKAQHEKYTKNSPNLIDNQDTSIQYASAAIPMGLNSFQIVY